MGRAVLIINPSSGKAKIQDKITSIKELLAEKFHPIELFYTDGNGDAEKFAFEAAKKGAETVICAGGDGTIREVVNGLMRSKIPVKLGILPIGTVNDVGRSLRFPLDPIQAAHVIVQNQTNKIDVGKVNGKYFISLLAVGGIPAAIHDVRTETKTRWGALSYLINGARYAFKQEPFSVKTYIDGKERTFYTSLFVISLHNSVAGMTHFFSGAQADDGYLRIMFYPTFKLIGAMKFVAKIVLGKIANDKQITITKFKEGQLEVDVPLTINMDGDRVGEFPITVSVLGKALEVYVPKK